MMKYTFKQNILSMFIYIIENKQIDYNTYIETYGIQRISQVNIKRTSSDIERFKYMLNTILEMINILNINCTMYKELNRDNPYYHFHFHNRKIKFDIYNLTKEQYNKYDLYIIYLILISNQYLTYNYINEITNGSIHQRKLTRLKDNLKEVIIETLIINPITLSYQLIYEDI